MTLNTELTTAARPHIDDILGPSSSRYFGEGFKRTVYAPQVNYRQDNAEGHVQIRYRTDWSKKKTTKPRNPHLSTVDAILIAGQIASTLLQKKHRLSKSHCQQVWLRSITINAGQLAEEDLDAVPVHTELLATREDTDSLFGFLSQFKTRLGTMEIDLCLDHTLDSDPLNQVNEGQYFTQGYLDRLCDISGITPAEDNLSVTGDLRLRTDYLHMLDGVMGAYPMSLMVLDIAVSFAQLAQVMMYRLDNLDRAQTNNLWMRHVTLTCPYPIVPRVKQTISVINRKSTIIPMNGENWRLSTATGAIAGHPDFTIKAKLCHALPKGENA
ncbi:AvrD family protein [Thaumasiovibrio subtropicus]|uniref:AvrD family protein n=1 Tax=Thaumasiovibrio subtropicus TaxID=1891207 RepID=UPI000B3563EB|nr:AvrD family protein [Thaumasiovibrio subtropicus]